MKSAHHKICSKYGDRISNQPLSFSNRNANTIPTIMCNTNIFGNRTLTNDKLQLNAITTNVVLKVI
ncbi:MAG: hypothetical protein V7L29_14790 [Nostoc sp.]